MALISCPDCKKQVSDKAKSCPQCGRIISDKSFTAGFVAYSSLIIIGLFFAYIDFGLIGVPMILVGALMLVVHLIRKLIL